jgi:hypothetical protein
MRGRSLAVGAVALAVLALLATPAASAPSSRPGVVIMDARSGRILARVPIDDLITSAVPDGRGGWYVGGFFTRIGGHPRRGLGHLLPNGTVDPDFRVSVASSRGNPASVRALARAGELLYVGCACGLVGGLHRPGLAAIDLRTGAVLETFEPGLWSDIDRLAVTGERLLVARSCCTYPVPGIAALDLRTGAVDRGWNAGFRLIGDASVFNALVVHGVRVFAAGAFRVSGLPRNGLVALDARTGALDRRWAPKPPDCPVCRGFASLSGLAVSDKRVYVSGSFSRFNAVPRNGVVALDPRTGAVDRSWRPASGNQGILTIALAGGRLYLGTTKGLLALDADTGAAMRAPKVPFREVFPLAPSGRRLLVGGR